MLCFVPHSHPLRFAPMFVIDCPTYIKKDLVLTLSCLLRTVLLKFPTAVMH